MDSRGRAGLVYSRRRTLPAEEATGRGGLIAAVGRGDVPAGADDARRSCFPPQGGDLLTTVIYYGGFIGDLMSGALYFVTVWLGYKQPDVAGHVHDYGTEFLVAPVC